MILRSITLKNYRNFENYSLDLGRRESGGQELSYIPQTRSKHNIIPQKSLLMCSVT